MKPDKKRRVALLVSDDEKRVKRMKAVLDAMEFDTVVTIDAIHAARLIEERRPAFVCADLILPRGSGHDVCRLVRANPATRRIPILVMDDRGMPEEIAFAEEAGANALLKKPFSMEEFRDQVEATLQHAPPSSSNALRLAESELAGEAP